MTAPMTITFLGTGNAIPTKLRNHTGVFVQIGSEGLLVDCGEGTQRQFMAAGIPHSKITHIFITHWHGDHVLGLPGLIQTLALEGYQKTLHIHGPKGTQQALRELEPFMGKNLNAIKIKVHEPHEGTVVEGRDFVVQAMQMSHGIPCFGYSISLKDKRKVKKDILKKYKLPNSPLIGELQLGKDITWNGKKITAKQATYVEKGKKVTVILDTHRCDNAITLAKDSELLVIESTFTEQDRQKADEALHLTAKDAATIAKKAKVQRLALIHISQRYEHNLKLIENEAKKTFKKVILPKDLDRIEI